MYARRIPLEIPQIELPDDLKWLNSCTNRNYYNAIWATLLELRPKYCLELGTFLYYSARIFSKYFELYEPQGILITADISTWNRSPEPPYGVYPVMVYPYQDNVENFHGGIQVYHKDYKEKSKYSHLLNTYIIGRKMEDFDIDRFQFIFIDADHCVQSFENDFFMSQVLSEWNAPILVDDIYDPGHELSKHYPTWKKDYNIYEFENWVPNPGMCIVLGENND